MASVNSFNSLVNSKNEFASSQIPFPNLEEKDRILVVDHAPSLREKFVNYFSAQYSCVEATSVREALEHLSKNEFALIITELIIPGISGIELLRKVIENHPYTPVIMVSAIDQPQRVLDALRLGAFKPYDLSVLELAIERALEHRRLLLNARQYKLDLEIRNRELSRGKLELQRLQSQIVHNEKMASLGQLAAGIAHELNNPVGFIYGNINILSKSIAELNELLNAYDEIELSPADREKINSIKMRIDYEVMSEDLSSIIEDCREGSTRIRDIVQNLRTFSRLDEAEFKKTDVNEGIDSTIRLLSRYYSGDKIVLKRDFGTLPLIDAFSGQLNQVWMNLLANAAQAIGKKEGVVTVKTCAYDENVVIEISDTGCGIPFDEISRIFEPFYTTKPVGEGTGLGLSISFSIIEQHQGTISVDSRVNQGTTFTVTLPINMKLSSDEKPKSKTINENLYER
jgi:two-component system, NtrC family, sensor kinase